MISLQTTIVVLHQVIEFKFKYRNSFYLQGDAGVAFRAGETTTHKIGEQYICNGKPLLYLKK
jgi:hypothetical protein